MQGKSMVPKPTTLKGLNRENAGISFSPSKFAQKKKPRWRGFSFADFQLQSPAIAGQAVPFIY